MSPVAKRRIQGSCGRPQEPAADGEREAIAVGPWLAPSSPRSSERPG
ncbi:MAG: hypothetical protein AAF481_12220 [Acidobacteriota bacterium]